MNGAIRTVIVAPMTTQGKPYPTRVACQFAGKQGLVALDQIRAVAKERLGRKLGAIDPPTMSAVLARLRLMFEP